MDALRALDHAWFRRVHESWRSEWLDALMPLVGSKWMWLPVIGAFFVYSGYRNRSKVLRLAIVSIIVVAASDWVANTLKGEFQRLRPGQLASRPDIVAGRRASFSFPSAAATNSFAVASLWSIPHPELALPAVAAAAVVSYSRVYVGDHYPADVIAGALLGCLIGLGIALVERRRTG